MNRLIIIGNGFDLAHGLPTSYRDFINDYWKNVIEKLTYDHLYDDELFSANAIVLKYNHLAKDKWEIVSDFRSMIDFLNLYQEANFSYKNAFYYSISYKTEIQNWVDIENEYYNQLKRIVEGKEDEEAKKSALVYLNEEFDKVKILLENYLTEKILKVFNFQNYYDSKGSQLEFPNIFKPNQFFEDSKEMKNFLNEFPLTFQVEIIKQFSKESKSLNDDYVKDCNITFLNFNYTPTLNNYVEILKYWEINSKIIHIHGFVNDNNNKINFGFGDEMDDDYKKIENINDNEYLKNFKSFQYLHTSNYKNLLNLIDSDYFQVYLMGHSCGLSDRTLLNTIFEHNNCKSIKVFYHEIKDEKGNIINDNYTEITQNISRHFNDKKLMREKIVNKTLCQPLPQIQLPKKE